MTHLIIRYHAPSEEEAGLLDAHPSEWLSPWSIEGSSADEPHNESHDQLLKVSGEARLPIIPAGDELNAGQVYLDLRAPGNGPFVALEGQKAGEGNRFVSQGRLPSPIWNELVKVCARASEALERAEAENQPCTVEIVVGSFDRVPGAR